jgi:hypothetical protein
MPAIRRQSRRFLLLWCCRFAALAWVFLRRFGVRTDFLFRPLGRPTLANDGWPPHPKEAKVLPRTSGFSLGAKNSLVEAKFQGHELGVPLTKGHPWPIAALATSMSLNP